MAHQVKLEIFVDENEEYRWRLIAGNGEIVAASESYTRAADAKRSAERVKDIAGEAIIGEEPGL